jgi:hypothetical protein
VYTDKGGTVTIWHDRKWIGGAYVRHLLDRLGLHVSVADGCPGRGWADVDFPVGVDRREEDSVGVVGGCVDVLHNGLGSGVDMCCGIVAGVVWVLVGWR